MWRRSISRLVLLGCITTNKFDKTANGGAPILGLTFTDVLALFAEDPQTRAVVMIGEIGGSDEENGAAFMRSSGFDKPVVAFISGRTAPPGKRLGHAGAIISGNTGTAQSKIDALTGAGAAIADTIEDVVRLAGEMLGSRTDRQSVVEG